MKGLSSIERIILESIGTKSLTYKEVLNQTGLQENVCFNVLQALIIRGLLKSEGSHFKLTDSISPLMLEEINSSDAKKFECFELLEALIEQKINKVFRFQKIAMDSKDEKIFLAMLSNLETFLIDAHRKAEKVTPMKERKVIFWGVGEMQILLNQLIRG